tara:strand:- start:386 stop:652 length:267 start_codon:yes stop_codon:yes gene_type:complete
MKKKELTKSVFLLFIGFSLGLISVWPGIVSLSSSGRKCFYKIITDGIDGKVSAKTALSITPNYLLKIKNSKNNYFKVLLIGDYCFRRF